MYSTVVVWRMARALGSAWLFGLPAGIAFWVAGLLLENMGIMPSGAIVLGILAWIIASNLLLAARVRIMLGRRHLAGVPRKEARLSIGVQIGLAAAGALVMGLAFEAIVFGLMEFSEIVNPYYCIIAFGVSFVSFWLTYLVSGEAAEPQT